MTLEYTNGHRRAISGASLAQLLKNMSAPERAIMAADILDGHVVIVGLTRRMVTAMCRADAGYVDRALRLTRAQRAEVCRGDRQLVSPRVPCADFEAFAEAIRRAGSTV